MYITSYRLDVEMYRIILMCLVNWPQVSKPQLSLFF